MNYRDRLEAQLNKLDDRMMHCWQVEQAYQLGIGIGRLHEKQMQQWFKGACKGPEPVVLCAHLTEHYVGRRLRKQWYRLAKQRNK